MQVAHAGAILLLLISTFARLEPNASMPNERPQPEFLFSLPPCVVEQLLEWKGKAFCDPPETKLGSGGGTAHLLYAAMQSQGNASDFGAWLRGSRKILVHGGGQSRRLPAYAATGKPLIPLPIFPGVYGQTSDQTLLSFQAPAFERVFAQAPDSSVVMIASGDVLLRFGRRLPTFPEADIIALGMEVSAEVAQHFGVFFLPPKRSETLAFFLQKPTHETIQTHAVNSRFLVDTGMWLLSERAVMALMAKCGWNDDTQTFANGIPTPYELYADFGLALGTESLVNDPEINALTCAIVPLPEPEFYHLGTSRQMIESVTALQERLGKEQKSQISGLGMKNTVHILNSRCVAKLNSVRNQTIWIENSLITAGWRFYFDHVFTNVPNNNWKIEVPAGTCLDFAPMSDVPISAEVVLASGETKIETGTTRTFCVRTYGIDDTFSGAVGAETTLWFGRPAAKWFAYRGMTLEQAGIAPDTDIQKAKLFPIVVDEEMHPDFIVWLFAPSPKDNDPWRKFYLSKERLSAQEIGARMKAMKVYSSRRALRSWNQDDALQSGALFTQDLERAAQFTVDYERGLPFGWKPNYAPLDQMHALMYKSQVEKLSGEGDWQKSEIAAFSALREAILNEAQLTPVAPRRDVLEDQIVWGRSPVRLDLAGGWTDTPPYCLEHGGKVVNLAVNLNGQPPVQVFIRLIDTPEFIMRSIDQGREERVGTYEELDTYTQVGSAFALPKAALTLCGFLPRFHADPQWKSLREQLEDFGGGLEISLLAAVPAGSGLGTSSILASTILGTLNDVCGFGWDRFVLMERTLMVEQMLTTGGGWQDQAGGLFRGIKLLETMPGIRQEPTVRWLPEHLFSGDYANKANLLYYTGLTRLAKNILQEIVRGMFLNNRAELEILRDLEANALATFDAVQRADWDSLCQCVATSWTLNTRLDAGTNTPGVQAILDTIGDYLAGTKLLGAGGGGYLLMMAKDEDAATRIRQTLSVNPPNAKARFVNFDLSPTGLEVTRS